jgi:glycosyltransferase involved in cell wall biosynthesis
MTRILQVVLTLHTGGLERIVVDLINRASSKFEHWVCCLEETGDMAEELSSAGVPLIELRKGDGLRPRLIREIDGLIRANGISLVHTHNSAPAFYGGIGARLSGVPVVHTKHGLNLFGQHLLNRVSFWFTDAVVAVSESAARLARNEGVPPHRLRVIDNGVDMERFVNDSDVRTAQRGVLGVGADTFVIGSLGRLSPVKNHELLIRAFADLLKKGRADNAVLLLAGDGPARAQLEELVAGIDHGGRIRFTGMLSEPEKFYPVLDAFVMPSRSEGLPVALLEAMACEVPVVVTRVGAMPRVAEGCGIIVEPGDQGALAAELHQLMTNGNRGEMGQAGRREVAARYSLSSMVEQYEALYDRLLFGRKVI